MTVYLCLDDRGGMLFNHRRQSRDAAVLADIQSGLPGTLTIDPFSEKLISGAGISYTLAPGDLSAVPEDAHFFAENRTARELLPLAEALVIYRWNRHYPADVHWDADLSAAGFSLGETTEFPGKSHETITKEVYVK